ncbi:beta-glucosidase family protein [Bifidobacterium eulemuris]|uniref:Glycoside hydrolase family 3 C-terminal domain-containing protein n=1 Tax=Bifidobacterium eulemuris TaxID=1765219 RepID=A0A261GED0_9BIFI|nr:glycoside hydrolase family 3 C-terminal domain-containing protein [Bifidobacterium eulemuris]OZG69455.1 glycosyl hydrolase [Bifidobacterium eulemuris]QOL32182.1 glycoside hydrolase family 3 C-terminal domain-containing protein [Bifidobacterium eulemuris]
MTVITEANKTKASELLAQLTLDEKIGMIHAAGLFRTEGVPRLGIPSLKMDDGPMGVRAELHNDNWMPLYNTRDYVTYLPSGSALASTWSSRLARLVGEVLGEEARGRGKDVILGPSINIKRSPLCGRNFEYMSEDPQLTADMGVAYIQGVQESDVAACAKHYAANSQETDRLDVDETIGERALREIYLPAFEAAVNDGGALSLMGAYNLVNGTQCCESKELLDDILRGEWGFDGFVVSDWSAVKRTKASAEVGLDVEMSVTADFDEYFFANPLKAAIESGEVSEADVDRKVWRVLCVMDALHMLGDARADRAAGSYATVEHTRAALDVARESVVLLKNEAGLLPLDARAMRRLLVVGANADRIHSNGGGSAVIKALHEVSPLLGLNGQLGGNVEITYAPGYDAKQVTQDASWQEESLENSVDERVDDAERARELRDEAVALAREFAAAGDPVLFVGGLDHEHDLEGRDREDLRLPYGQDALIEALLDAAPNTILAFVAGSPVAMPWAERATTIVWSWYNGCEGGTALAETLLGRVNPSGHLPETFPLALEDCPAHAIGTFGPGLHVDYAEDVYVGYRHYETRGVPVLFPFGHGLSYTDFEYRDLDVRRVRDDIRVSFTVANVGAREGKAVPQVYLGLEGTGEDRPVKELRGFAKVALAAGESRQISIMLDADRALRYWSNVSGGYATAPEAAVHVGESAHDIRLFGRVAQAYL